MVAEVTLYLQLSLRQTLHTAQLSKSQIVRAPLRGYPRSGARTIDDFKSWSVLLEISLHKGPLFFHVTWVTSMD